MSSVQNGAHTFETSSTTSLSKTFVFGKRIWGYFPQHLHHQNEMNVMYSSDLPSILLWWVTPLRGRVRICTASKDKVVSEQANMVYIHGFLWSSVVKWWQTGNWIYSRCTMDKNNAMWTWSIYRLYFHHFNLCPKVWGMMAKSKKQGAVTVCTKKTRLFIIVYVVV